MNFFNLSLVEVTNDLLICVKTPSSTVKVDPPVCPLPVRFDFDFGYDYFSDPHGVQWGITHRYHSSLQRVKSCSILTDLIL